MKITKCDICEKKENMLQSIILIKNKQAFCCLECNIGIKAQIYGYSMDTIDLDIGFINASTNAWIPDWWDNNNKLKFFKKEILEYKKTLGKEILKYNS